MSILHHECNMYISNQSTCTIQNVGWYFSRYVVCQLLPLVFLFFRSCAMKFWMSYISYLVKQEPDRAFIKEDRVHENFVIFFWLFLQFNIPSIDSIYYLFFWLENVLNVMLFIIFFFIWGGGDVFYSLISIMICLSYLPLKWKSSYTLT